MPTSAPKACRHPGCKRLARNGSWCIEHKPPVRNFKHGSAGKRRTGRRGVEERERIHRRDNGLCQHCLARGIVMIGTEVDHITPLSAGGNDTDSNKQLLCSACHKAKTATERKGGRGA